MRQTYIKQQSSLVEARLGLKCLARQKRETMWWPAGFFFSWFCCNLSSLSSLLLSNSEHLCCYIQYRVLLKSRPVWAITEWLSGHLVRLGPRHNHSRDTQHWRLEMFAVSSPRIRRLVCHLGKEEIIVRREFSHRPCSLDTVIPEREVWRCAEGVKGWREVRVRHFVCFSLSSRKSLKQGEHGTTK